AHIAVRAARYRFRHHGPHLLRHHPDIGGVAAVVDEAIIAETVVESSEQHDIVFEAHVGATPAAAAAAAALHSTAADRAAIGEGRVGPAHSHSAHRRAAGPADAWPRCGTV